MNDNLTLQLSTEQINLILEALGKLPFEKVYQLISTIQAQAQRQLAPDAGAEEPPATKEEG